MGKGLVLFSSKISLQPLVLASCRGSQEKPCSGCHCNAGTWSGVGKLYLCKVIGESDDMSRVISCERRDSAVFVFMFELEVLVEFLFIDIIVVHDLVEFFKLFDEVNILSRFLKF
jgi:hypothetical protein